MSKSLGFLFAERLAVTIEHLDAGGTRGDGGEQAAFAVTAAGAYLEGGELTEDDIKAVAELCAERDVDFVVPMDSRFRKDVLVPESSTGEASDGDVVVVRLARGAEALEETRNVLTALDVEQEEVLA